MTIGNRLIVTPKLLSIRWLLSSVAIVILVWRKKFGFFSNFGTFMYLSLRRPLSVKEKSMLFHP